VVGALAACLALGSASGAAAATVTLGPGNLAGASSGNHYTCGVAGGCTFSQAGPGFVSPISGVIVRWRIVDSTGPFTLRVINDNIGGTVGPTENVASKALQEFPAAIPIKAGEEVGLDIPTAGSSLAFSSMNGASIGYWSPVLAPGETRAPKSTAPGFGMLFNADVQPPPGISALTPSSGPIKVANTVVIAGHDLTGASSVSFGSRPATRFTVDSDAQITAVAPVGTRLASVQVTVATVAGTALSAKNFRYEACRVPKLKGRSLKAAKKQIRARDCRVGKATKRKGATAKGGKVRIVLARP
jgi:IPT/TIG domain